MSAFLPPETSEIVPRVVARNARRARRLIVELAPAAAGWRWEALAALESSLACVRGPRRVSLLFGPGLRGWLCSAEEALLLANAGATDAALFERIARGSHLAEILPRGRLDRGFRRRASALGRRQIEKAFRRLPPILAGCTPPESRFGPFPLDLDEDGEEARRRGEIHIDRPVPATVRLHADARLELAWGGLRLAQRGAEPLWAPRETLGDSGLVLARRVVSTRGGLKPGPRMPGLARRLGDALALIRDAWEPAHREVLDHTRVVVPLVERGTVSFSLPDRPGVSYINLRGKTRVDLADDLIHEAAHHRLHSLEELARLDRDDGEPRYWSPWRRTLRPLHGILHAAYTFTWRAGLLARLLRLKTRRLPRAFLATQLQFEIDALRQSLDSLADAQRRGLLTRAGSGLRRAIAARVGTLR